MALSVGFIIVDILSVTPALAIGLPDGINPFWKLAFVFKCFTDTIILDDFKTALDKLKQYKLRRLGSNGLDTSNFDTIFTGNNEWQSWRRADARPFGRNDSNAAFGPWNESRGITSSEGVGRTPPLPKKTMDQFDVEMAYWTRRERADSHDVGLSPCASKGSHYPQYMP